MLSSSIDLTCSPEASGQKKCRGHGNYFKQITFAESQLGTHRAPASADQRTCFPSWAELWMLHPEPSVANTQGWCKPQAAVAWIRLSPKRDPKKITPHNVAKLPAIESCEECNKHLGEGLQLSLQPRKVNAPWMRNWEQKRVLSVGTRVSAWTPADPSVCKQ